MENYKKLAGLTKQSFEKGERGLDMGCGDGSLAILMAEHGLSVEAVDASAVEINKLNAKKGVLDIKTFCEDIRQFNFEKNKYRLILARHLFSFIADKKEVQRLIVACAESLVSGGQMGFTLFGHKDDWRDRKDMSFFELDEITAILEKSGVNILEKNTQEKDGLTMMGTKKHWHIHTYVCEKL